MKEPYRISPEWRDFYRQLQEFRDDAEFEVTKAADIQSQKRRPETFRKHVELATQNVVAAGTNIASTVNSMNESGPARTAARSIRDNITEIIKSRKRIASAFVDSDHQKVQKAAILFHDSVLKEFINFVDELSPAWELDGQVLEKPLQINASFTLDPKPMKEVFREQEKLTRRLIALARRGLL